MFQTVLLATVFITALILYSAIGIKIWIGKTPQYSILRISKPSTSEKMQSTENARNVGGRILHFFHTILDLSAFNLFQLSQEPWFLLRSNFCFSDVLQRSC